MSKKLITVFGATGAQGSSVLRSLVANTSETFKLRGTTRNPLSNSAQQIATFGVEVVKADGWDKDAMLAAFKGSWGVFVNTNSDDSVFEDPNFKKTEVDLGKLIVDAAVQAGVEVFVYSGFNSAKEITGGKVANAAFDGMCSWFQVACKLIAADKHAIGEYAKFTGAFKYVVLASPGSYFENFTNQDLTPVFGGFPLMPSEDGTLVYRTPKWGGKEDVPHIAIADDFGDIVHGIFLDPEKWNGKLVQGVSEIRSFEQAVQDFKQGLYRYPV